MNLTGPTPRDRKSRDLFRELHVLKDLGYSATQAVEKSKYGSDSYRFRIFYLLEHGDTRLIEDVEKGRIPFTVAIHIAGVRDLEMQKILVDGYKAGTVKGPQINEIRQIIDDYRKDNATPPIQTIPNRNRRVAAVIGHFRQETDKQKLLISKARIAKSRLASIVKALKLLFSDKRFVALLIAEGNPTMPSWLAERIKESAK